MRNIEGGYIPVEQPKIAIVAARFNSFIVERLIEGAMDCLGRHDIDKDSIDVYRVPGCFEIPLMASKLAQNKGIDAIICLGTVIRGDTPHFEYVASEVSKGVAKSSVESGKPVIYGILTTDTIEQAIERAGTKAGNRGFTAALDALEMIDLLIKADENENKSKGNEKK